MPLILALDRDQLSIPRIAPALERRMAAEIVQARSAAEGLVALRDRVPDLILTPMLLPPGEDAVLGAYLRTLGSRAAHVRTLRIPILGEPAPQAPAPGLLARLLGEEPDHSPPNPCDPETFAAEIATYLVRLGAERADAAGSEADPSGALDIDLTPLLDERPPARADTDRASISYVHDEPAPRAAPDIAAPSPARPRKPKRRRTVHAGSDGWFDPSRCGFASLVATLDDVTGRPQGRT